MKTISKERVKLRGIVPVLQIPFCENDEIDEEALRREVDHCLRHRVHALTVPIMGSEFWVLTHEERRRIVEIVVEAAGGRIPVVAGVAAPDTKTAAELSQHAARSGADAVIALPPYVRKPKSVPLVAEYYRAIADASGLPVVLQNAAPPEGMGLSPQQISLVLDMVPEIRYIKEEQSPSIQAIHDLNHACGTRLDGILSGTCGMYLISELDRGAVGCIPSAAFVEYLVPIYELYTQGQRDIALEAFETVLPLLVIECLLGVGVSKEVLRLRGVFKTSDVRDPQTPRLTDLDLQEIASRLRRVDVRFRSIVVGG